MVLNELPVRERIGAKEWKRGALLLMQYSTVIAKDRTRFGNPPETEHGENPDPCKAGCCTIEIFVV